MRTPHKQETALFHQPQTACTSCSSERVQQRKRCASLTLTWFSLRSLSFEFVVSLLLILLKPNTQNSFEVATSFHRFHLASGLHQIRQYAMFYTLCGICRYKNTMQYWFCLPKTLLQRNIEYDIFQVMLIKFQDPCFLWTNSCRIQMKWMQTGFFKVSKRGSA